MQLEIEKPDEIPRRNRTGSWDYYRTISLFSTFCIGLCLFGLLFGFVSDSQANKRLWAVILFIFLISQSLLHFVDKFTRIQLSRLPIYLLNASRPVLLLRLYYIGLLIDIFTLSITLIIAYFLQFPEPLIASIWFILLTTSWYNTNELRIYFVKSLEDVPSCSDAECQFHSKLDLNQIHHDDDDEDDDNDKAQKPETIILNNKYEKIIYTDDKQTHFHYNPHQNILSTLDGIKSWTSVCIMTFCVWCITFFYQMSNSFQSINNTMTVKQKWGFIILVIVTIIQGVRISFQVW